MLQKFKITSCAFILCLFGVTLTTVSPVLAEDSTEFQECQLIKPQGTDLALMKQKKDCFKDLARVLEAANVAQEPLTDRSTDPASQLLAPNAEQEDLSVKISDLEGKLSEAKTNISHLERKFGTANEVIREQQAQLTKADTKYSAIQQKLETALTQELTYHATINRKNAVISDLQGQLATTATQCRENMIATCERRLNGLNAEIKQLETFSLLRDEIQKGHVALIKDLKRQLQTASAQSPSAETEAELLSVKMKYSLLCRTMRTLATYEVKEGGIDEMVKADLSLCEGY